MKAWQLPDTGALLEHLMASRSVYAPASDDGEVTWQRVTTQSTATSLSAASHGTATSSLVAASSGPASPNRPLRPLFSPKQFFFAEREQLYAFDGRSFRAIVPEALPFVLFGVTACDLVALAYQDRFFAEDAHYQKRRSAALLVGIDCGAPCENAFCHTMQAGPAVVGNTADLVLFQDAEGGQFVLSETALGEAALIGLDLAPAPEDWLARRARVEARAVSVMSEAATLRAGIAKLNGGSVTADTWEKIGLRCVACSGCTTVCPTCSCFAPRELPDATDGAFTKERVWDSCLFESFQREASGANPSASAGQRVERFWYHKLSDDFAADFGRYGCVGCGRCDTVCPGSIGANSVLRRLAET